MRKQSGSEFVFASDELEKMNNVTTHVIVHVFDAGGKTKIFPLLETKAGIRQMNSPLMFGSQKEAIAELKSAIEILEKLTEPTVYTKTVDGKSKTFPRKPETRKKTVKLDSKKLSSMKKAELLEILKEALK